MLSSLLDPVKVEQTTPANFEIGVVYRSPLDRYYLAVDRRVLITFVHDVIVICDNPKNKFSVSRTVSVEKLCNAWRINQNRLDEMSAEFFAPIRSNKVKRRLPDKFSNREVYSQDMVNTLWARHRTHRLSGTD